MGLKWGGKQRMWIRFENRTGKRLLVSAMQFVVGTAAYGQSVHIATFESNVQALST